MSDNSSGFGILEIVIIILIVLGCIGIGPCIFLKCDMCSPVPQPVFVEAEDEESLPETDDLKNTEENRKALEKLEKRLGE